jgi:regulator of nonsense transcripts 2
MNKKLLKSQSKDQIDERSTEFLKYYGALQPMSSQKGWRKRTAKILFEVPRS